LVSISIFGISSTSSSAFYLKSKLPDMLPFSIKFKANIYFINKIWLIIEITFYFYLLFDPLMTEALKCLSKNFPLSFIASLSIFCLLITAFIFSSLRLA
jgi:predicted PurR-regulated permease PerM